MTISDNQSSNKQPINRNAFTAAMAFPAHLVSIAGESEGGLVRAGEASGPGDRSGNKREEADVGVAVEDGLRGREGVADDDGEIRSRRLIPVGARRRGPANCADSAEAAM